MFKKNTLEILIYYSSGIQVALGWFSIQLEVVVRVQNESIITEGFVAILFYPICHVHVANATVNNIMRLKQLLFLQLQT